MRTTSEEHVHLPLRVRPKRQIWAKNLHQLVPDRRIRPTLAGNLGRRKIRRNRLKSAIPDTADWEY